MTDLTVLAHKLALQHVAVDADRGISEHAIQLSRHGHSCPSSMGGEFGSYTVDVGLCQTYKVGGKNWPPTKVVVSQLHGLQCLFVFSLHELYLECQRGQLALL